MDISPRRLFSQALLMFLASGSQVCAEPSSSTAKGVAAFLRGGDLAHIISDQKTFAEDVRARAGAGTHSALDVSFIRAGLADAAPQAGVGGRSLSVAARELSAMRPSKYLYDKDPIVRATLLKFLEEASSGKRIVGGAPVPRGAFRDVVAIVRRSPYGREVCSGVVVGVTAILTAAHCVCDMGLDKATTSAEIIFGDSANASDAKAVPIVPSLTKKLDGRFCEKAKANGLHYVAGVDVAIVQFNADPALVFVDREADFVLDQSEWVGPYGSMRLAPARIAGSDLYLSPETTSLLIVGFGINDYPNVIERGELAYTAFNELGEKMFAEVPIASKMCSGQQAQLSYGCVPGREAVLVDWKYNHRDTCQGDSGGPVYVLKGRRYFLAALTSRSVDPNGKCGPGGIYTLISPRVLEWVRNTAKNTQPEVWNID